MESDIDYLGSMCVIRNSFIKHDIQDTSIVQNLRASKYTVGRYCIINKNKRRILFYASS